MAGSCHWQLIFERWAIYRLGNVKPTPRKDIVIFRANWVKILKQRIYWVMDEDKYSFHVPGQPLSHPSALYVKCETDMQRNHLNAVRHVPTERERTPCAQLRQALAAVKENVDTRVRVSRSPACHRGQWGQKIAWRSPQDLFRRRSGNLFQHYSILQR